MVLETEHQYSAASSASSPDSLADVLDRILDKGVVVAGDISISLVDVELITIKLRLLIASADKAEELGMDWWRHDPFFSSLAKGEETEQTDLENRKLRGRIASLEERLETLARNMPEAESDGRE